MRDLWVIVTNPVEDGPLFKKMLGDAWTGWTNTDWLLAELVDGVHWLQWAKTKDGQDGRNRPEPVPRPTIKKQKKKRRVLTLDEVNALL
ncbi:DUF5361 domain-containing protein [Trueperella pyogenes]|uniref:DUF5361 domain-containing protein n=1 Tax=Trueperella pyogenes TaxID=1661 RepID=UPI00339D7F9C